jgi:hypothetical protein
MRRAARLSGTAAGAIRAAVAAALLAAVPLAAAADGTAARVQQALVDGAREVRIRNDRGGYLPRVVAEVAALNRAGIAGRIDGGFCFSACTVYLALTRVCVAPWTQFGFHAPRDAATGDALHGAAFERATAHVAQHYRPALAAWWMREGRHVRRGLVLRSGAELIAMGYPACPPGETG